MEIATIMVKPKLNVSLSLFFHSLTHTIDQPTISLRPARKISNENEEGKIFGVQATSYYRTSKLLVESPLDFVVANRVDQGTDFEIFSTLNTETL